MGDPHVFESPDITVTWSKRRCIHAAECVRGLPAVFEPGRKPWILAGNAAADEVAEVVRRCPTGALHFERHDGRAPEAAEAVNGVVATRHGPLHLRGDLEIAIPGGGVLRDTRAALCRCGRTRNAPFCDGSHHPAGFRDAGGLPEGRIGEGAEGEGPLRVTARPGGPLKLSGPFTILSADGQSRRSGGEAALCRCGQSGNKPFCDGSHRTAGFAAEGLGTDAAPDAAPEKPGR